MGNIYKITHQKYYLEIVTVLYFIIHKSQVLHIHKDQIVYNIQYHQLLNQ